MSTPQPGYELLETPSIQEASQSTPASRSGRGDWIARLGAVFLCVLHGLGVWVAMGGLPGLASDWPILLDDHGIHYEHGLMAREFLRTTGMNAGYDPNFMSGYPLSIVSDLSSTLSDIVMMASGNRPALGYKLQVLGCTAAFPWLIVLVSMIWKLRPGAVFLAVLLADIYFWADFPHVYPALGMQNYLLSIPLGLLAVAGLAAYCERGGFGRWLWAASTCSAVFLVHLTSPMLVAPAGLLAYGVAVFSSRKADRPFPVSRHLGLWLIAPVILAVNSFWLVPGFFLASTKGASDFAFSHSGGGLRGVLKRIGDIIWIEGAIQPLLLGLAPSGLIVLGRRNLLAATGLGGFMAVGFGWGYLAGAFPALDSLQPGRHTYACYSAAGIAAGIGLAEVFAGLRSTRPVRLDGWFALALVILSIRLFGQPIHFAISARILSENSMLSSQPTPRALWIISNVKAHVKPGERLLYEETGLAVAGLGDPFGLKHLSPILPQMTGVEVIGGPYLHSTVTTNFTQFGENKLFEKTLWDRAFFLRHAQLYRPSAICCWSPRARAFCLANPDLIKVVADDRTVLLGQVIGFGGATIRGSAEVEAGPNRLVVRNVVADPKGDGKVILRYHAVPYLKADPPVEIEPILVEDDPVPFIGLKPTPGPVTIEMVLPPRTARK